MRTLIADRTTTAPTLADADDLQPGSGEVLLQVLAAAVNPVDVFIASGDAHPVMGLPDRVGLGWDVVGTVAALGDGVDALAVGDVVAGLHDDPTRAVRTHAEQVVLPAAAVAVVPAGLDPQAAASVPLNALTASQAVASLGEPAGRSLLVTGAAGAVGGYAVALAAAAGWRVTGLARAHDEAWVRSAGATDFATEPEPAAHDAVLDPAVLGAAAVAAVRDGGTYVGVIPSAVPPAERGIETRSVLVQADGARLAELLDRSASGELEVRVAGTVPLDSASAAYDKVSAGGQRGRWLLVP